MTVSELRFHTFNPLTIEALMTNEELSKLATQVMLIRAELLAQNTMLKAMIQTHPVPDVLRDAFVSGSEKSVSIALGSQTADGSIAAFEFFRDRWLEWLPPLPGSSPKTPPKI